MVVTGIGAVTPVGHTVPAVWDSLVNGKSGLSKIEAFDVSSFPTQIAGVVKDLEIDQVLDRKQAKRMDRFCQLGMVAAMQAVEDAGLEMASVDPNRVGVYASSGIGGLATIEAQHQLLLERGPGRISPLLVPMMIINLLPGNIAMHFGMKGPNLSVVTACATGNHNLGEALLAIRHGMADVVVSGGAEAPSALMGL
ncbi:MAG TPA: beta-ketoacyl synthase N-terminal-like domain-containing protein, partial [bacterium]|nr:beta-ketoacyl synthase N-terminal-like domain-containing protein [bacterium]